jgi:tetratricopeptide (TPR) repeat protein
MNLRRCFVFRQLLFLLIAALITPSGLAASGQESITLRGGSVLPGTILGVTPQGIQLQTSGGNTSTVSFALVEKVTMDPPPEFTAAQTAYGNGDMKVALKNATAVVRTFRGLPTEWAQQALLLLGDIYTAMKQYPQAAAVYADFKKVYPGAPGDNVSVAMAQMDIAHEDYEAAGKKLDDSGILAAALKKRNLSKTDAALYGRAFYISGQIKEHAQDFQGALEDYLRTVAIFPGDRLAAANAQERADALCKDHGISVP